MSTLAAEFPNDNPALHCGVTWVCRDVTGPPAAERASAVARYDMDHPPAMIEELAPPTERDAAPEHEEAPIVVEELEPVEACVEGVDEVGRGVGQVGQVAQEEALFATARISEVVLVGTRSTLDDEREPAPALVSSREEDDPCEEDPFAVLVAKLVDVALGAGAVEAAAVLPELLEDGVIASRTGRTALEALTKAGLWTGTEVAPPLLSVARAWRDILRGASDDFDACGGAPLDEWASELLAKLLGDVAKAPRLRQELRSRGVAAFGLAA